ncbi:MAG TPA: hypothetical protein VM263_02925 [Acidimicrobiales bacterium]|nr:hypothetical protein [Acidimicrobiales bacterium]
MGGDHISAHIAGSVSGQVAVGSSIHQVQAAADPPVDVGRDLAELRAVFADLRSRVADLAPAGVRDGAVERLDELHRAIVAEDPSPATVRYVARWFARRAPGLAGAMASAFAHPVVARLVDAAEPGLADEMRATAAG